MPGWPYACIYILKFYLILSLISFNTKLIFVQSQAFNKIYESNFSTSVSVASWFLDSSIRSITPQRGFRPHLAGQVLHQQDHGVLEERGSGQRPFGHLRDAQLALRPHGLEHRVGAGRAPGEPGEQGQPGDPGEPGEHQGHIRVCGRHR